MKSRTLGNGTAKAGANGAVIFVDVDETQRASTWRPCLTVAGSVDVAAGSDSVAQGVGYRIAVGEGGSGRADTRAGSLIRVGGGGGNEGGGKSEE